MKQKIPIIISVLTLIAGIAIISYPLVSDWLSKKNDSTLIQDYQVTIEELNAERIAEEKRKAIEYNDQLSGTDIHDPFIPGSGKVMPEGYLSILNIDNMMGYVEIPKIDVYLPIYHGTEAEVLEKGIGHLDRTSVPIGGIGYHTVLTGHRGLPSAKLFTDLDKVEIDDVFYIYVLDEVLAYKVDNIIVVDPGDTNELRPIEGKDYATLITCTPYSINSHRLFVRGIRIPYDPDGAVDTVRSYRRELLLLIIPAAIGIVGVPAFIYKKRKKAKQKQTKNTKESKVSKEDIM